MQEWIGPNSLSVVGGLILVLASGAKGIWQFRFQTEKELGAKDAQVQQLKEQIDEQRRGSAERLEEMRLDRDAYRDIAFEVTGIARKAAGMSDKGGTHGSS